MYSSSDDDDDDVPDNLFHTTYNQLFKSQLQYDQAFDYLQHGTLPPQMSDYRKPRI